MGRKNRAKSIWENDLRVYLVSLSNNARINLYCRQQNWEDLISSLRKIITTKSKNTFLSQENNKLLLQQTIEWLLRYSLDGQAVKQISGMKPFNFTDCGKSQWKWSSLRCRRDCLLQVPNSFYLIDKIWLRIISE
jgi:hypothetical protein